jgi:DNA mismatch repair ATPase MutS
MANYQDRYTDLLGKLEKIVEEAAKEEPEIAEELRNKFDAAEPVLDEIEDILEELDDVIEEETGAGE